MMLFSRCPIRKISIFKTVGKSAFSCCFRDCSKSGNDLLTFLFTDFRKSFVQSWGLHIVHSRGLKWRYNDTADYFPQIFSASNAARTFTTNSLIVF